MSTAIETDFQFGTNGCSALTSDTFEAICTHPEIGGTTPLVLDVPVPKFAPIVPPNECACFEFEQGHAEATVSCTTGDAAASVDVKIEQMPDTDCCRGKYKITPTVNVAIPCCTHADWTTTKRFNTVTDGRSTGYVDCTLSLTNCQLGLSFDSHPLEIRMPTVWTPCLAGTSLKVKVSYKDSDGETHFDTKTSNVTAVWDPNDCLRYSFEDINIDLGTISGSSSGFSNGGGVFLDGNTENVWINGDRAANDTWYGGGLGDKQTDDPWNADGGGYCRGQKMRNTQGQSEKTPVGAKLIPTADINVQQLVRNANTDVTTASIWMSNRKQTDQESGIDSLIERYNGKKTYNGTNAAGGNLDMLIPSGFQWHERGTAAIMSRFLFNDSGVLSEENETDAAVLLSPAPVVASDTIPYPNSNNGSDISVAQGMNVSGLCLYPGAATTGSNPRTTGLHAWSGTDKWGAPTDKVYAGLAIKAGEGLRIYNAGDGKTEPDDTPSTDKRQGSLEIQYGAGLRIATSFNGGEPTAYREKPSEESGAIEPNPGRGVLISRGNPVNKARDGKIEINAYDGDFMFSSSNKNTESPTPAANNTAAQLGPLKTIEESAVLRINDTKTQTTDLLTPTSGVFILPAAMKIKGSWGRVVKKEGNTDTASNEVIIPLVTRVKIVDEDGGDVYVNGSKIEAELSYTYLTFLKNGVLLSAYTTQNTDLSGSEGAANNATGVITTAEKYRSDANQKLD